MKGIPYRRGTRRRLVAARVLEIVLSVLVSTHLGAQDGSAPEDAAPKGEVKAADASTRDENVPAAPATSESYDLLGPPLFPLYDHYLRRSDQTEVLNVLYLYRSTSNSSGDASNLLFPFYYWEHDKSPPDRHLYLFPLLFFHRKSEERSFNFFVPFFFDYRTPTRSYHSVAPPLWFRRRDREAKETSHHVLFPLSRYRTEEGEGETGAPVVAFRFGIFKILEFFESYRKSDTESRLSALSLFNFAEEAESPIALFHSSSQKSETGDTGTRTHLFPLLWTGKGSGSSYLHIPPVYFQHESADRGLLLTPLFGRIHDATGVDSYIPLLLSRFGESTNGEVRRDIFWPLYHRSYGPGESSFYSLPLFNYSWTPEVSKWRLLQILYGNEHYRETGKTAHTVLWPLGRFDVEPDGITGHRRLVPLYYDSFDAQSRLRLSPLFVNYQWRSGEKVDYEFLFTLPDYFGWGSPDDYFGVGFPLFWKSRSGKTGWDLFMPAWFSFFRSASWGFHLLPIVGYNNYPSEKQYIFLGPTLVHRRYTDFRNQDAGSTTNILWPLTAWETRPDGYHYRLLPLFWASREKAERDMLIFPFWYRQWGGKRSQDYFFAAYGRYKSDRIVRDFYGLGTYIHTRERNPGGEFFRNRKDVLWSLLSFQENRVTHQKHQHFYPLGFWNTTGVSESRQILGPLLYRHRIEGEEGKTHRLNMVMGNFWLSREVDREIPIDPEEVSTVSPAKAPGHSPGRISSEKGVLWPLVRWGFDTERRVESQFVMPFYFNRKTETRKTTALFPLLFLDQSEEKYQPSYFRFFFLADFDRWAGGYRLSLLQLLADYMQDRNTEVQRWRFLFPLSQLEISSQGYKYQLTPLIQGRVNDAGGQRESSHFGFPLYWTGATQQQREDGSYKSQEEHFYLFPLFGVNRKSLRTQRDFLLPFIHTEKGLDSFKFQVRPFVFVRNDPAELSVRLWPIHGHEKGEASGQWWVSRYLYFSKSFVRQKSWSYRLDPFLFRVKSSPDTFDMGALFKLFSYRRKDSGTWTETSYHALALLLGYSGQNESLFLSFPFYYQQDVGERPIDDVLPWRFLFLVNRLRGDNGERITSFLWKALEYRDNPARRDEYHEFRLFYALYEDIRDVSFRQWAIQPLFFYSSNRTDPLRPEKTVFILPLLGYRYHTVAQKVTHYLFWKIPVWW